MASEKTSVFIHSGRVLIALYFLVPGLMKFAAPALHLELMAHHNIPFAEPLLYVAAATNVIGALLLMSNRHVRLTALGFALYILVINGTLHDFWNFEGVEGQHEMQNFIKNLGIMAGCLVLAGASKVRGLSFSNLLTSDKNA